MEPLAPPPHPEAGEEGFGRKGKGLHPSGGAAPLIPGKCRPGDVLSGSGGGKKNALFLLTAD